MCSWDAHAFESYICVGMHTLLSLTCVCRDAHAFESYMCVWVGLDNKCLAQTIEGLCSEAFEYKCMYVTKVTYVVFM